MCTYNISISDAVIDVVRPAFADDAALSRWLQQQIELLLIQYATSLKRKETEGKSLSSRLRGIATAPKDFDYKEELANRYEV
jgi:predicted metal-dependent hydrolase